MRTDGGDENAAGAFAVRFISGKIRVREQTKAYLVKVVPHV
jgi:hypothetical protein